MNFKKISSLVLKSVSIPNMFKTSQPEYKPTLYLTHPLLQSIYNIAEPKINLNLYR